jgi:DNA-binding GntR family transcriptional regulator
MKLEKLSLVDRAVQQLRRMIIGAALAPDQRLTEQELSDEMQVGRGTVRAALAALTAENLVVRRPYAGWTVQTVDDNVLRETYEVRGALEELSVRLLARQLDEATRAELLSSYDRLIAAEDAGAAEERLRADLAFHAGIVRMSGNDLLIRQYESISGRTEWLYRWSEKNWPRRINLIDWHKPILEAILATDEEAAAVAVRSHTYRSLHDDMQDLQNKPPHQDQE